MKQMCFIVLITTFILPLIVNSKEVLRNRLTALELYETSTKTILSDLEPYFQAYEEAKKNHDTVKMVKAHELIALCNTLESWRWKFYQYGKNNLHLLTPREEVAWKMVNTMFTGRITPPSPEDMLKISPEQIRESLVREIATFKKVMGDFEQLPNSAVTQTLESNPSQNSIVARVEIIDPKPETSTLPAPTSSSTSKAQSSPTPTMPAMSSPPPQQPSSQSSPPWTWGIVGLLLLAVFGGVWWKFLRK